MADINDLLGAVVNKSPISFANSLADIMADKVQDAIASRKVEVASSIYGESEEDLPQTDETDNDDLDVDMDLDDFDADADTDVDSDEAESDTPEDTPEDDDA